MWEKRWGGPVLCNSQESCSDLDRPGDRDLHLPWAVARSCHHAQAVPLLTSSAAGSSVGSLRVAGLITRIQLSRKMGKSDSVGTGEAQGTRESALQKAKGQESIEDLTGATAALSAVKVLPKPQQCPGIVPALQQPAGKCTGGSKMAMNPQEKSLDRSLCCWRSLWPPSKPGLRFWGEPTVQNVPGSGKEQLEQGCPISLRDEQAHMPSHTIPATLWSTCHGQQLFFPA